MALDAHIIEAGNRRPEQGSDTGFGFGDEHDDIFHLVFTAGPGFSQLTKMQDYYDDVIYTGQDLIDLDVELERAMPQVIGKAHEALARFRELCQQALRDSKAILLLAD